MTGGLKRYYGHGDLHYITCSCYQRRPLLSSPGRYEQFVTHLEKVRKRYGVRVGGYVVMPEHFHLVMSEPARRDPSVVMFVLKQPFSREVLRTKSSQRHFWMPRFYDFNVYTHDKLMEKIRYMHNNPVVRGLVNSPEEWPWSSARYFKFGEEGLVKIDIDSIWG